MSLSPAATSLAQLFVRVVAVFLLLPLGAAFSNSPLATAVWLTHTRTRIPPSYAHTRFARSLSGTDSLSLLRAVTPALPISRYRPRSVQLIIILNRQLSFVLILCFQFESARAIYAHSLRSCFYFFFYFSSSCFAFAFAVRSLYLLLLISHYLLLPLPCCVCRSASAFAWNFLGLCE